jgi:hypothetical protein
MIGEKGFNPHWFIGIVEQVEEKNDGRLKVRCFGYHPTDTSGDTVDPDDLPWAYVINGNFNKAFNWPEIGQLVFGFFMDGRDAQFPFVLGSISGGLYTSLPRDVTGVAQDYTGESNYADAVYDRCSAYNDIRSTGLTHAQTIGVMVNIQRESEFIPGRISDNDEAAIGLFQYSYSTRREAFINAVPDWRTNPVGQIRYAILSDPEGRTFANFEAGKNDAVAAANHFTQNFEDPAPEKQVEYIQGGKNAQEVAKMESTVAQCSTNSRSTRPI